MIADTVAMWDMQHSTEDWDYSKTLTLLVTLKTQKCLRKEFYVSLEVENSFPEVGCVRNKLHSHGSTESEVISSDAGLRMDGIPSLDLWHLVIEVLLSSSNVQGNLCDKEQSRKRTTTRTKKRMILSCPLWITLPQTQNLLTSSTFLDTMKQ